MLHPMMEPVRSLYIHVPFCARKCDYCAFFSEATTGPLMEEFTHALVRELELVAPELAPETVFFGGGTPSLLSLPQWENILRTMERLGLLGASEWTIECNPATVSDEKAALWRRFGVNRISMGVQSFDEQLLERLGRIHSRDMVFRSYDRLRHSGFSNLNLDLMFAIPGQSLGTWERTLEEALALRPEHLSCYEVIYEEDTPLFDQLKAGRFAVDEELACQMYETLVERASAGEFQQYEVANFAKDAGHTPGKGSVPSYACRHNLNYWLGGAYHGLGPSACGYVRGERTRNHANTRVYCQRLKEGHRSIEWRESLSSLARAGETAAFGLRMTAGWSFEQFRRRTGFDLEREWRHEIAELVSKGWANVDSERLRLTRQGLRFADAAAAGFLR